VTRGHPHWLEFHRLRTRRAGRQRQIDLHLVTCGELPLEVAHEYTEDLEEDITRAFPGAEIITHVEACTKDRDECDDECPMYEIKMRIRTRAEGQ
jgi:divalent metal cation (Fe/Co/Zn/Cd) transporter